MTGSGSISISAAAAALLALGGPGFAAPPPPTPLAEIVLYAVDADTHELFRYTFANDGQPDDFNRIGVIIDQNGFELDHPEGFTYIPSGPNKGFYAVPTGKDKTGGPKNVLARINAFDASAEMIGAQFTYKGIRGMTTIPDGAGGWRMLALAHANWNSKLVEISPTDGAQTVVTDSFGSPIDVTWSVMTAPGGGPCAQSVAGCAWEGLALHYEPDKLFGISGWALYEIDLTTGAVTLLFQHTGYERTESLEIAFGNGTNQIDIPGVPTSWTQNGALFSFSDNINKLLVYDIGSGNPIGIMEYDCSFVTVDCEGLVFMTKNRDPYGALSIDARD